MKTPLLLASLVAPLFVLASVDAPGTFNLTTLYPEDGMVLLGPQGNECPQPVALTSGFEGPMAHVRYLADDALEGREVASLGERCAAEYIAARFEAMGLLPAGDEDSFFQNWDVRVGSQLALENQFTIVSEDEVQDMALEDMWVPLGYSGSGSVEGVLSAMPEGGVTDGAHRLDGAVLLLEGTPDLHRSASEAARMGAAAVVMLLGEGEVLPTLESERRAALDIPVVALVSRGGSDLRLAAASQHTVQVKVSVEPLVKTARNVAALLPGSSDQTVILGAHYDHLGRGGEGSLSPNEFGTIHNGADDNASGTAVLVEVAERLSQGPPPAESVLFLAFSGEERGLWGSARYVEVPLVPLESTRAMLNMDMVGRVVDDKLTVFGTGTAEEWEHVLERANDGPLQLQFVADGFGSSDHSSFYAKGIPVLHFFSGTHAEYHRTKDDWQLINEQGLRDVASLVTDVVATLTGGQDRIALTPVEGAGNPHAAPGADAPDGQSARSGFSVRLGTIPDYSQEEGGMRISGVRDDSPAAKAGIQGGDVIVRFGDRQVEDVYGYMYALQDHQPGDVVEIEVLRGEERLVITVTLEGGAG